MSHYNTRSIYKHYEVVEVKIIYHSEGSYFDNESIERVFELLKSTFSNESIAYSIDYIKGPELQLFIDYMEALRNRDEDFIERRCDHRLRGSLIKERGSLYPSWY